MMRQLGAHCSMLLLNGRYISTQAASMRFRWLSFSWVRKNSSSVSCLRSFPKPQGLAHLQVADHSDEFHLLAEVDLIHAQLFQPLLAPRGTPALQIPQVNRSHRAGNQSKLPGHLSSESSPITETRSLIGPLQILAQSRK